MAADSPDPTTLAIDGPATMAEAARWRESLLGALGAGRAVRLDLAGSGPWDVAGLQLVLSALATARRDGRAVTLARVPRGFWSTVERAGVAGLLAGVVESREP